eukprot:scaffold174985_cov37-Tisochrysis_lutea.AAC.4
MTKTPALLANSSHTLQSAFEAVGLGTLSPRWGWHPLCRRPTTPCRDEANASWEAPAGRAAVG